MRAELPDRSAILVGMGLPLALLASLALGSGPVSLAVSGALILSAVLSPAVGLMAVALLAPVVGRPVIPYPGLMAVLIGATILGSILRLPIERPRLHLPPVLLVILGFMLYVFVQQLPAMLAGYSGDYLNTGSMFLRLLTAAAAVVAAALVLPGRSPYPYLAAIIGAAVIAASVAILMYADVTSALIENLVLRPERDTRPGGVFVDPNYYGMFIATALAVAMNWFLATHAPRVRWLLGVAMLVLVGGLIVSQSRSALLALLVAIVVSAFVRARALGILVGGAAVVLGALLLPVLIELRLTNAGGAVTELGLARTMASDAYRLDAVLQGPQLFLTSPIFGVGLGNYLLLTGDAAHNWYSVVLAEQGLLGLGSLLLLLGLAALSLRRRPTVPRAVGYSVLTILAVGGLFLEPTIETQWSVPAAILVTAAVVCRWDPDSQRSSRMRP